MTKSETPTRWPRPSRGLLALVGGGEWQEGSEEIDAQLLERSGSKEVLVLPTAAAYERPERAVDHARRWFASYGATVRPLMVLSHEDAAKPQCVAAARQASFIYIGGGSPLHLRSVLKATPLLDALRQAWQLGASLAGSSAGAMALCDPMADPRGGGLGVGLGFVEGLVVLPHHRLDGNGLSWRAIELAPPGVAVAGIPEKTALLWDRDASWRQVGASPEEVTVYRDGEPCGLDALPDRLGKS